MAFIVSFMMIHVHPKPAKLNTCIYIYIQRFHVLRRFICCILYYVHDTHLYPVQVTFWDRNRTQHKPRPALGPSILAVGPAGTRPCSAVYSPGPTSEAECTSLVRPPPKAAEAVEMWKCDCAILRLGTQSPEQQACKGRTSWKMDVPQT